MSKKKGILFGALTWLLLGYLVEMLRPTPAKQENNFGSEVTHRSDAEILQRYFRLISLKDAEAVAELLTGDKHMPDHVYRDALHRFGEQCIVRADVGNELAFWL